VRDIYCWTEGAFVCSFVCLQVGFIVNGKTETELNFNMNDL
jgi:hypothetical protein